MSVIGPIDRKLWNTLRLLRGSIEWDKQQSDPKLKQSTDWLTDEYKYHLKSLLTKEAS